MQKVPYMVIIGAEEVRRSTILSEENNNNRVEGSHYQEKQLYVTIRTREGKDLGLQSLEKFINILKAQIEKFQ